MIQTLDLRNGDSAELLKTIAAASADAVVTDPPAGIAFMGKTWDTPGGYGFSDGGERVGAPPTVNLGRNPTCQKCGGRRRAGPATKACLCEVPEFNDVELRQGDRSAFIASLTPIFVECLRVLKPGGHALIWALPRTSHWTATAIEDAGFEIRDVVMHLFGTGFPKAANAGRQIDMLQCGLPGRHYDKTLPKDDKAEPGDHLCAQHPDGDPHRGEYTALKPAAEHWILARKPLDGTVARTVLDHGTGALNIDGCRIGTNKDVPASPRRAPQNAAYGDLSNDPATGSGWDRNTGRWPANVALSHSPGCRRAGTRTVSTGAPRRADGTVNGSFGKNGIYNECTESRMTKPGYPDPDGKETIEAYDCEPDCAVRLLDEQSGTLHARGNVTPTKRDCSSGVTGWGIGRYGPTDAGDAGGASRFFYCAKPSRRERNIGGVKNIHPTVKSRALMAWLIRLITPPGGTVLDPFMGSGSTGVACIDEGCSFIGIEREAEYFEIAKARIAGAQVEKDGPPAEESGRPQGHDATPEAIPGEPTRNGPAPSGKPAPSSPQLGLFA